MGSGEEHGCKKPKHELQALCGLRPSPSGHVAVSQPVLKGTELEAVVVIKRERGQTALVCPRELPHMSDGTISDQ